MTRRAPAHVRRAALRAELARELAGALYVLEVEQLDVAAATSASSSVVQRWCDRTQPHTLSLADVVLVGESYPQLARELLHWAAARLDLFVAELPEQEDGEGLELALRVQRETSEAVSAHLAALQDGAVDPAEARECLEEIDEAVRALLTARALMRSRLTDG